MPEYGLIALTTFIASWISFYSGFGLGTVLMPVMALFLPLPLAIGLTAIVHLFHNLLKAVLLSRSIDWRTVIKFGSAAFIGAIPGALLLKELSSLSPAKEYLFMGIQGHISWLNITIGLLLITFATLEAFPHRAYRIKNLGLGGAISGFFGGLSGNQGALRSAFLFHTFNDKEGFIGTNAMIAVIVDSIRLLIYGISFHEIALKADMMLLATSILASTGGILVGVTLIKKMTLVFIQRLIIGLLYVIGSLLILGII